MDVQRTIDDFLDSGPYAVIGASSNREKYGNKVLRCYKQHGLEVYPVNPRLTEVEGLACHPDLHSLPVKPRAVSVITPPRVTERVVEDVSASGAKLVWLQPGSESDAAIGRAESLGLSVIAGGPCLLVTLGFHDV